MGTSRNVWMVAGAFFALAGGCADDGPGAVVLTLEGSNSVGPLAERIAELYTAQHADAQIEVLSTNSGDGVRAVGEARADVGMASRPLTSSELMTFPGLVPVAIGRDAIGVIVHPSNDMASLTLDQTADIFAGRVTDWSQLGRPAGPITVFAREEGSGTRDFFEGVVLGDDAFGSNVVSMDGNVGVRERVAADPLAIGFASFGALDGSVRSLAIDAGTGAVIPDEATVRTETYPITRPLLLIHPATPTESAEIFIDFALSPSAQEVATDMGYVSVL